MNKRQKTIAAPPPSRNGVEFAFANTLLLSMALLGGMWSSHARAVPVTAPTAGEIEKITINDISDHWSGGVIVAGGQNIIIPKNLLIDLPANRVTLQQLFTEASNSCQSQHETGLAKGDTCNASGTGGLATIQTTRIDNGNVIAGDVFIEKAAEVVTGQITYINYSEGYFRVNGNVGSDTTGVMVRLNDPDSRHTVQSGAGCATGSPNCSPDPRFTLDGDNYTNVFSTGYPMCIPSTQVRTFTDFTNNPIGATTSHANADGTGDVLCPVTNRTISNGQPVDDSRRFAPIMLGDSIMAEGNYELVGGVTFLSAHSSAVSAALSTKVTDGQPDYMFLDEVEIDAPGFQNQRARSLIIGYATLAPTDIMIWSIHYDPQTNSPHEFPLASSQGCDNAAGVGTCSAQGLVGAGANIFKIRHDVDFAIATKPRTNPCAHLQADPRFAPLAPCSSSGVPGGSIAEQFAILSPIPHEIQARTGRKFDSMQSGALALVTIDINGNDATNGQYLFPFGMGLGGISTPEMNEINLDAMATPLSFSGIPWNLDRRLSPGGCLESGCENTPQPLDPFPFEGVAMDPRILGSIPASDYSDPNYLSGSLNDVRDRILSYVDPTKVRPDVGVAYENYTGNFTTSILNWAAHSAAHAAPPSTGPGSGDVSSSPNTPQALICSANSAFNSPPVAQDDSASTASGAATTVFVLLNDSDVNGDPLTVTGVSTPSHGVAAINIDLASITYTPALGFSGTDTFTYTVFDGTASVTATVTINVNAAVNSLPIAVDDLATVAEDATVIIDVLANDTDNDSGTGSNILSVASVSSTAKGGTVTISGDPLTDKATKVNYTPKSNFNGVDTFTYVVSDGRGGIDTGAVTVTVTAVNDAPVANPENATVVTGGPAMVINVLDNDTDVDLGDIVPDLLTVSLPTASPAVLPTKGTVTTNGATVSYSANAGATGVDSFTYTITDKGGLTATTTVTVSLIVPVKDVVQITQSQFIISKSEWRVNGTGTVPNKTITVRLGGAVCTGGIVGTSVVDTLGNWIVRVKPGIAPGANTTITACSNGGGKFTIPIAFK